MEMAILEGKKAIIIGDRDGIPGPAIEACLQSAGRSRVLIDRMLCLNSCGSHGPGKSKAGEGNRRSIRP